MSDQDTQAFLTPLIRTAFVFICLFCAFVGCMLFLNWLGVFVNPISGSVAQFMIGSIVVMIFGLGGGVMAAHFAGLRK